MSEEDPGSASTPGDYQFVGPSGSSWDDPADWEYGPAGTVPGPLDDAAVDVGLGGPFTVTGSGSAQAFEFDGHVVLDGTFRFGIAANRDDYSQYGQEVLEAGSDTRLQATSIAANGGLIVDAGAVVSVSQDGIGDDPFPGTATVASLIVNEGMLSVSGALEVTGSEIQIGSGSMVQVGMLTGDPSWNPSLTIDRASSLEVGFAGGAQDGYLTIDSGSIVTDLTSQEEAQIRNDGTISYTPDPYEGEPYVFTLSAPISGNGTIAINSAIVEISNQTIDPEQEITFNGKNGVLVLGADRTDLPDLYGFTQTDAIKFDDSSEPIRYSVEDDGTESATVTYDLEDDVTRSITFEGDYTGENFQFQQASPNPPFQDSLELVITSSVACFCPGTLITVEDGVVPVECLSIGDRVVTSSGLVKPVLWIGRRSYERRFAAARADLQPVRIYAGALGDGLPRRDLLVSPKHALLVQEVLVPAELLVNDISIVHDEQAGDIHYLHVELEDHDLLLAEGAAAESFVDDNSRTMFQNVNEYDRLYPDRPSMPPTWCAVRVEDGPLLVAAKQHVDRMAGLSHDLTLPPVHGYLEEAGAGWLRGWAWCADAPDAPVLLDVLVDGKVRDCVLADRFRGDLVAAGLGSGCHGFELFLSDVDAASLLSVRRAIDRCALSALPMAAYAGE